MSDSEEERRRIADAYGVSETALGRTQAPDVVQDEAEYIASRYGLRVAFVRRYLEKKQEREHNG